MNPAVALGEVLVRVFHQTLYKAWQRVSVVDPGDGAHLLRRRAVEQRRVAQPEVDGPGLEAVIPPSSSRQGACAASGGAPRAVAARVGPEGAKKHRRRWR